MEDASAGYPGVLKAAVSAVNDNDRRDARKLTLFLIRDLKLPQKNSVSSVM